MLPPGEPFPDAPGDGPRVGLARVVKDHGELLAAVAAGNVALAQA
jgi:hypothetical protein